MARLTYARVYTRAFRAGTRGIDAWVRKGVRKPRPLHRYVAWTAHVRTMARTQHVGEWMCESTREDVERAARLAFLGWTMRLRVLQARILRYLWRPGGRLCALNGERALACVMQRGEVCPSES